jgi:hypothetical protein
LVRGGTEAARIVGCEVRMITTRRFAFIRVLVIVTEALLISVALIYLAEYAGMSVVREAGGGTF